MGEEQKKTVKEFFLEKRRKVKKVRKKSTAHKKTRDKRTKTVSKKRGLDTVSKKRGLDTVSKKRGLEKEKKKRGLDDVEYFVIIGHGSENKLMGIESEPLTSRPYAISTPPGHYSLFSLLGNLNLLYSMKALAKHRPGASFQEIVDEMEKYKETFLSDGIVWEPGKEEMDEGDDPLKHTVWRLTRDNLDVAMNWSSIYTGKNPTVADETDFINANNPYGIYRLHDFNEVTRVLDKDEPLNQARMQHIQGSPANIAPAITELLVHTGHSMYHNKGIKHHDGIDHYPNMALSHIQNALYYMYPGKEIRIVLNLCRVYNTTHEQSVVPGTRSHRTRMPGATFEHTKEINTHMDELSRLQGELSQTKGREDKRKISTQIEHINHSMGKIQESIDSKSMVGNLMDGFTTLGVKEATKGKKKKTRKPKKKKHKKKPKKPRTNRGDNPLNQSHNVLPSLSSWF